MVFISSVTSCSCSVGKSIPIGQYQQIKDLPIPDNAKEIIRSNLIDKKYREESAKIVMPLKNDNDKLCMKISIYCRFKNTSKYRNIY
jgi:hypothetical protein